MESHYEYLIRYLSDEFLIELAHVPYPPYNDIIDRYPDTSPLMRNPDDYDLLVPLLPSHVGVEYAKYAHKMATIMYEPGEGQWTLSKAIGVTTPKVAVADYGRTVTPLRFGIDTELFNSYPMLRDDNDLRIGVVGSHANPRRMIEEAIKPLYDLEGVRIMFFPSPWVNSGDERVVETYGGKEFLKRCVAGEKKWPGLPNIYNQFDVLLRIDAAYGYSFPCLEAAACGVPIIATDMGIDHAITGAGGGILIGEDKPPMYYLAHAQELADAVRNAVIYMRDNPKKRKAMGKAARKEIEKNWTWDKCIPAWREFFRKATT